MKKRFPGYINPRPPAPAPPRKVTDYKIKKEEAIFRLHKLSERIQDQIKGLNKCFEESEQIAAALGYKLDRETGKLIKI